MNELSRKIISDWQVRKTRAQKTAFIEFMQREIPAMKVEQGGLGRSRNLIVGDIESADVIFGAHYDTCARLPFPNLIMPKNIVLTLLYSLLIVIPFILLMKLTFWLLELLSVPFELRSPIAMVVYFAAFLGVFMLGRPNPHTANDNTSGVVMLCELMAHAPENVAFVFFDNEENGLLGSSFFRKRHKKLLKNKLLINFCSFHEVMVTRWPPRFSQATFASSHFV